MIENTKPKIISGIQPTKSMTIGNYIGVLDYLTVIKTLGKVFLFVADNHALTTRPKPEEFKANTIRTLATFKALFSNEKNFLIFLQSAIPQPTEMFWLLNNFSSYGDAIRMPQFKAKSDLYASSNGVPLGTLTYPILMAADILIFDADLVPVGDDQIPHIEFCQNLVAKINNFCVQNGSNELVLKMPRALRREQGSKIMSLQDPTIKMSKTTLDKNASIYLDDSPDVVAKKISKATTDSNKEFIGFSFPYNAGIKNLMTIQACLTHVDVDALASEYMGKQYGRIKTDTIQAINETLIPLEEKVQSFMTDPESLLKEVRNDAILANEHASIVTSRLKKALGLLF